MKTKARLGSGVNIERAADRIEWVSYTRTKKSLYTS